MKWDATDHAKKRVVERFGVKESGEVLWINQQMEHAAYVTNAPDAEGKMRRVYVGKRAVFHASLTDDVVYSVIPGQKRPQWTDTIRKVADKELRKFSVKAIAEEREWLDRKYALEIDIVNIKASLLSVRSDAKRSAMQTRFNELCAQLMEAERLITENRRSVVRMAESYSVVM